MNEILKKTWKSTTSRKFWNWLAGGAGSVIAIIFFSKNYWQREASISLLYGLGILVGLYILRFILFFCKYSFLHLYNISKERMYGNVIIQLNEILSSVYQLNRYTNIPDDKFINTMAFTCQQLKAIFDKKTKSNCSVSIKLSLGTEISASTKLKNLCRDKSSVSRDTEKYTNTPHLIFLNTCYNTILTRITKKDKKTHYINNDIGKSKDYENTSRESYENGLLPYNSEIVVPITPKLKDEKFSLVGFLCLDSDHKNVFDENYDIAIMEQVAEGIFDVMRRHKDQKNTSVQN